MKIYLFISIILSSLNLSAQVYTGFQKQKQYTVRGGTRIIGNNIASISAKKPYNDVGYHAKKNDRLPMVYIDIDDDASTFSSSSADLKLPESINKITHATLYWTATYQYEKGDVKKGRAEYIYTNEADRVEDYNKILFKTPEAAYVNITGKILEDQKDSIGRPYLCYADVTSILKQTKHITGTYTVANIRASQGHILGGSSGGWMLLLIYENNQEPLKQIDIYHGFQSVSKSFYEVSLDISDDFNDETEKSTLFLGALEGDERLKTDEVAVNSFNNTATMPLHSVVRPKNNFFNSTITYENKIVNKREPNSLNTLGFDLATLDITKNLGIYEKDKANKLKLKFSSVRDMFLLFFMGVEVEINQKLDSNIAKQITINDSINNISDSLKIKESLKIEGISTGYYLITNVFSDEKLANKWKLHLKELGYTPQVFVNPKNNWQYIYVDKGENIADCYPTYKNLRKNSEFKEIWLLEVIE